jgi:hypothetical protein
VVEQSSLNGVEVDGQFEGDQRGRSRSTPRDRGLGAARSLACLALGLALLGGCGGHDDANQSGFTPLPVTGPLGVPSPALIGENVVLVDVMVDGFGGGKLVVDTGSPFTIVNGGFFPGVTLPQQTTVHVDIGVGELTFDQVPAIQAVGGTMDQLRLAGLFGANVMRQLSCTFNYRDRELQLGAGSLPDGVETVTNVPFVLSGGGLSELNGQIITVPKTRIPITADIEGTKHHFILDTGASDVTLRTSVYQSLVADGRPSLDDAPFSTVSGSGSANATRARSITLNGQTVTNVPVLSFDDTIVDSISSELSETIDGLFGGDFLREFLLTIDYPHGNVELRRYTTRDHIVDEFQRVGVWLTSSGPTDIVVGAVHAGSDAQKKGVSKGDQILAIDGMTLSGLDVITADALLDGTPGQTHNVRFGQAESSSLEQKAIDLLIEDLIPAPN